MYDFSLRTIKILQFQIFKGVEKFQKKNKDKWVPLFYHKVLSRPILWSYGCIKF